MPFQKRALVVMPFTKTAEHHTPQYWARHFNSYLKPLIAKVENLEAFRSEPPSGDIANQIILDLINTDIAVADLTDLNPNVLWQLGVRQSFKNSTITIAETGTQIPFPFSRKPALFYDGEHLDNQAFEAQLQEALAMCVRLPNEPDSPVLETLGGRGTLYSLMRNEENNRRINGLQLELNVNEILLGQVFDNCVKNKELRAHNKAEAKRMTTTPLKTACAEFLLVNRYLDLDKSFYSTVYAYHNFVAAINGHLVAWESTDAEEEVEDWLLACKESAYKHINKLKDYLQQFNSLFL